MLAAYLKRNECKRYVKLILRGPLMNFITESVRIVVDAKKYSLFFL